MIWNRSKSIYHIHTFGRWRYKYSDHQWHPVNFLYIKPKKNQGLLYFLIFFSSPSQHPRAKNISQQEYHYITFFRIPSIYIIEPIWHTHITLSWSAMFVTPRSCALLCHLWSPKTRLVIPVSPFNQNQSYYIVAEVTVWAVPRVQVFQPISEELSKASSAL